MLGEYSSHYQTLQSIVDQLEFCEYQTEDGLHFLELNVAFVALKERAAAELVGEAPQIKPCSSCMFEGCLNPDPCNVINEFRCFESA